MNKKQNKVQEKHLNKEASISTCTESEVDIKERVIFRVCKKISKVIYLNGGKRHIKSRRCKKISKRIEGHIRRQSRSNEDYKRRIKTLVGYFEGRPTRVRRLIYKYS